ncbi:MAG: hypothetical protein II554_04455 [Bacteroidales bacterium]|nr:hypothetical protein [Bacteroidales bacterium]
MADAVSVATPFLAALFEWLKPFMPAAFLGFSLRCFNGYAVSRCAVSVAKAVYMPAQFLGFNGFAVFRCAVSVATPFLCLRRF